MLDCTRATAHRRRVAGRAALAAAFAVLTTAPRAWAATATFLSTNTGHSVQGLHNGNPQNEGYAGTFNIQIDAPSGPTTVAYCVDLTHVIGPGSGALPQVPVDYPPEVLFILNNAYPVANNIPTRLTDLSCEAAAVQCAIWQYTDNYVCTGPTTPASCNVAARASDIVAYAAAQAPLQPTTVPQSLSLTPPSATNFLNQGQTTHSVTANLLDDQGQPLAGYTINVAITAGPAGNPSSTSGPSPSVTYNYTNTGGVGTNTITASVNYSIPTGQKFKKPDTQGIVLAGLPQTGTLSDTATKNWTNAVCGNGQVEPGEQCDDGNQNNNDACKNNCTPNVCGDGVVRTGVEQCDDGNNDNQDDCTNACKTPVCGDQIVHDHGTPPFEECDDGNPTNNDGCTNSCKLPACGDGILQTGEQCDHGASNGQPGDSCTASCTNNVCGDGVVGPGEQCDDGNLVDTDACRNNCQNAKCGDGVVETGVEQCDDGNQVNTDACKNDCTPAVCGDGVVHTGVEQCDDGNQSNNDACKNDCTPNVCGDGILNPATEQCDDGDGINTNACKNNCTPNVCGDGVPGGPNEECDDGNQVNNDGCSNTCHLPSCGDGIVQAGEQCDDGNNVDTDACRNNCQNARCGDGVVGPGELCDDGNQNDNDTCTNSCIPNVCGDGFVNPATEQCDDGNQVDADACRNNCTNNVCGDGVPGGPNEQCDDGNQVDTDACRNNCTLPKCGDGIVQAGEECDLGGANSDHGACTTTCKNAKCGDGLVETGVEECDDANAVNTDACKNNCKNNVCGDGILNTGVEQCDDGNNLDGDGCSASCQKQEICNNQIDDDGDGLIDCLDAADCTCPVITPVCKHHCPATVVQTPGTKPDLFKFQVSFNPSTMTIDPTQVKIGVGLFNSQGIVYAAQLLPGDMKPAGKRIWGFLDKGAPKGNGIRGGLYRVKIVTDIENSTQRGEYRINVKAWADMSLAIDANMTIQVIVGNDTFEKVAVWTKTANGWKVNLE